MLTSNINKIFPSIIACNVPLKYQNASQNTFKMLFKLSLVGFVDTYMSPMTNVFQMLAIAMIVVFTTQLNIYSGDFFSC